MELFLQIPLPDSSRVQVQQYLSNRALRCKSSRYCASINNNNSGFPSIAVFKREELRIATLTTMIHKRIKIFLFHYIPVK